jgi:hypothetical protein
MTVVLNNINNIFKVPVAVLHEHLKEVSNHFISYLCL